MDVQQQASDVVTSTFNPEHVEIVRRGRDSVNAWKQAFPGQRFQLQGADLSGLSLQGVELSGADLSKANLQCADLRDANLEGARLCRANLAGAILSFACLKRAELFAADLSGAILLSTRLEKAGLQRANLAGADLSEAKLTSADLTQSNLQGAELFSARLTRACLRGVNLRGANLLSANLSGADLEGACLRNANLDRTDLSGASLRRVGCIPIWRRALLFWQFPFKLNDTRIRGARFESSVSDPWSILRRRYTWPHFAIWLVLLMALIAPQLGRALYLHGANVIQQWEQDPAYFFLLLLPAMIYTALRGGMTYRVRLLNDCEQRSGYSPTWQEYGPCYWLHVPGRLLFVFLCGSLLVHACRALI